jgi:hypothetical protein
LLIRGLVLVRGLDFCKGRFELQFEVNGKEYFLAFVEDERRWYVISANASGVERIPVYVDAARYEGMGRLRVESGKAPQ